MTAPWGPTSQVAASLGWIAILALALTPAAWSAESPYRFAPFECDSGWVHEMFTKEGEDGFSVEKCVDARGRRQGVVRYWRPDGSVDGEVAYLDGQKHGASRAYDLYGFLISEEIFEDGKPTQFHYTVRGLQKIAEIANVDLRA